MATHHGSTPAAWTAVVIVMLAFIVGGIGLVLSPVSWLMFWIGVVLLPIAAVVGKVMGAMGMGSDVAPSEGHG
ncbi:MAG: hypothetical protein GEU96_21300 [Propionibacteriales bacterium]|nr:hypothetical protein [Propionibacteriales bacterium]